nr:hypothetical protein [Tanacetum cinerariifolium]
MMAIAAGGNATGDAPAGAAAGGDAPAGAAAGGDVVDEANVVANDAAGDDTIHGGFHVESHVRSNDAPKPTADVVGRAEDPSMLTILSDKLDRCMGRIATLKKDLGTSKQVMGGAILKLVNRVKRLEKHAYFRRRKLVIADSDEEAEVTAEFHTPAFARFRLTISIGVPSPTVIPEPAASYVAPDTAGPSVPADKGKAPMPDLDIPADDNGLRNLLHNQLQFLLLQFLLLWFLLLLTRVLLLDWVNPEGQQYPHNLLQPLPLILDNRGRRVIPFEHFINNDLEYLRGATDRLQQVRPLGSFSLGVETSTVLWISVCRDDDQIYKFKEGDFKRLRLQDIEDMLLLLVQGKLSNLTVEEHFAFNVSLRMFTRSIVNQRRVEDLQLGVESYQKRLNLTKPDTYRLDLKRREAYTAHSNPRGFIYQNKDKKNRLMRIDELHKFSDRTLNDIRCLKGIRMQYLPTKIWRRGDKDRAAAMIQAIDKMLKTRRIMRSLEKFVGGRLYEGDLRMLQRTI